MGEPAVRLADVRFRWSESAPLTLDIPAFDVRAGERVFVEGPSGGGKTTLLNLLGGVVRPEAGVVSVLGRDLARLSGRARDAFRADRIGFVFQMFNLLPYLSTVENVLLPCRFSAARRARAAAREGGLQGEARRLLGRMGLDVDDLAGRPASRLSVGQQQRAAAARALIGAPGLIVADEPTSALDADSRDAFLDLLFQEAEAAGAAVVFVSHDAGLAGRFDRRIALRAINRAGVAA